MTRLEMPVLRGQLHFTDSCILSNPIYMIKSNHVCNHPRVSQYSLKGHAATHGTPTISSCPSILSFTLIIRLLNTERFSLSLSPLTVRRDKPTRLLRVDDDDELELDPMPRFPTATSISSTQAVSLSLIMCLCLRARYLASSAEPGR